MNLLMRGVSIAALMSVTGVAGWAQRPGMDDGAEGLQKTRVVVRVDGREGLRPEGLKVKVNGRPAQVNFVQPLAQARMPIEVLIAVDDGLRSFGNNLDSLKKLVDGLPPNAAVAVGYMRNGRVMMKGGFSTNREMVERQVRLPMGTTGANGSPYFTVSDVAKRWPSQQRAARFLLMITNGIDPYNGRPSPMNQNSPYVDEAISDAQKAGISVYSIFWSGAFNSGFAGFSGQSYLTDLSDSTGGDLLSGGLSNAPTIDAYVDKFLRDIERSYVIGLDVPANRRLVSLKVESRGAKVRAPNMIRVGN